MIEVYVQYYRGVPYDRSVHPILRYFSVRQKYNVQYINVPYDGNMCKIPVLLFEVELPRVLFVITEMCPIVFSSNVPCDATGSKYSSIVRFKINIQNIQVQFLVLVLSPLMYIVTEICACQRQYLHRGFLINLLRY